MKIQSKILASQAVLLGMLIVLGVSFFIVINKINPVASKLEKELTTLQRTHSLEYLIVEMKSFREGLQKIIVNYCNNPLESKKIKYNFTAKKLSEAINNTLRKSAHGTIILNLSVVETNIEQIETNIFHLAQKGKVQEAKALIASSKYTVLNLNYNLFLEQFKYGIKADADDEFSKMIQMSMTIRDTKEKAMALIKYLFILIAVLFFIGLVFSVVVTRSITKPIKQLIDATRKIAEGKLGVIVDNNSKDEIGILAKSFNTMTVKLKEAQEEMKKQVIEESRLLKELEVINKELENKVKEKTKQIIHSAKLASIGELAAGVGHEINNPLTILQGNLDIVRDHFEKASNGEQKILKSLDRQEKSIERIKNIVEGLRDYARSDTEHLELTSCSKLIESCILMIGSIYEKEEIEIQVENKASNDMLFVNRGRFQQVIMNLLSNAKDAMENIKRKKLIKIELVDVADKFHLILSDTGKGIKKENIHKIFDSFFTTKGFGQGTGLGLSITGSFIKEMNGSIEVESEVGIGTSFIMKFPLSYRKMEKESKNKRGKFKLLAGKILVVDDEECIRELLTDHFIGFGLEVEEAGDGVEALIKIRQDNYDLIVTDLKMPKMSGEDLITELRKMNGFDSKIAVITGGIVTGYSKSQREILRDKVDGYISKPFSRKEIYEVVSSCLSNQVDEKKKAV